jgi:hypothetical protein
MDVANAPRTETPAVGGHRIRFCALPGDPA